MRSLFRALLVAAFACSVSPAFAQAKNGHLLFAVNEGSSGVQDAAEIFLKYEEFMNHLGKILGKKMLFHLARDFKSLERGLQNGTYQLALVRPTNFAAQAIRNYSYNLVVVTKGGFAPHF